MTGIDPGHLRDHVIRPVLARLDEVAPGIASRAAERLLIGTALAESEGGRWLVQLGGGPARGPWQMELATHDDIWSNFLAYRDALAGCVDAMKSGHKPPQRELVTNLDYAAALARVHYWRVAEPLPAADDIEGLGWYWRRHYNTLAGAGRAEEFMRRLERAAAEHGV